MLNDNKKFVVILILIGIVALFLGIRLLNLESQLIGLENENEKINSQINALLIQKDQVVNTPPKFKCRLLTKIFDGNNNLVVTKSGLIEPKSPNEWADYTYSAWEIDNDFFSEYGIYDIEHHIKCNFPKDEA